MPNVMDAFIHLNGWETEALHRRRAELIGTPPRTDLTDDSLRELMCISRLLRDRASISRKSEGSSASVRKVSPSLDML